MLIIRINGGLGNQMFQLSLYYALKENGKEVYVDNTKIAGYLEKRTSNDATKVFQLQVDVCLNDKISQYADNKMSLYHRLHRKILGRASTYRRELQNDSFQSLCSLKEAYLDGYWQSEKFFFENRELIKNRFQFKLPLSQESTKVYKSIINDPCSVSIHVRGGDYFSSQNKLIYGNICTDEYYTKAIEYFKNKYSNCRFFVFSNDDQCKKKFSGEEFTIVDVNDESSAWMDMYLMSKCNHNIVANSSFSWWAAYLNNYTNKEIIAPRRWINTVEMPNVCPADWIRM